MITKYDLIKLLDDYADDDEFVFVVDSGKGELVYHDIIQLLPNTETYETEVYLGKFDERYK